MTDNEIIKALECCKAALMYDEEQSLYGLALSLINRQKEEIERLTKENEMVVYTKSNGWGLISFLEFIKNQRAEAIKEFAERLKYILIINNEWNTEIFDYDYTLETIENLVKEMVGDSNEGERIPKPSSETGCHHTE